MTQLRAFFFFFDKFPTLDSPMYEIGSLLGESFLMADELHLSSVSPSARFGKVHLNTISSDSRERLQKIEGHYTFSVPAESVKSSLKIEETLAERPVLLNAIAHLEFIRKVLIDFILPGQLGEAFLFNARQNPTPTELLLACTADFQVSGSRKKRLAFLSVLKDLLAERHGSHLSMDSANVSAESGDQSAKAGNLLHGLLALMEIQRKIVIKALNQPQSCHQAATLDPFWGVRRYLDKVSVDVSDVLAIASSLPPEPCPSTRAKAKRNQEVFRFADWYFGP